MGSPSPSPYMQGVSATFSDTPCEMCGAEGRVAAIIGIRPGARLRAKLNICAECLATVLEHLTAFHFRNQLANWDGMRARLSVRRPSARKVK